MKDSAGKTWAPDMALAAAPSVFFEAVAMLGGAEGDEMLAADPDAVAFAMDAKRHLKAIGFAGLPKLAGQASLGQAPGIVELTNATISQFVNAAKAGKVWDRQR